MRLFLSLISTILLFSSCAHKLESNNDKRIYVTITPLKAIIEELTCGDFDIEVIVPNGGSPEVYEPTPKQLAEINKSRLIFSTGLIGFEQSIIKRIDDGAKIVNLSSNIDLIEGSCSHGHHHHSHGVDPHIWTSPKSLRIMVENARDILITEFPDKKEYVEAADKMLQRINTLDKECQQQIEQHGVKAIMIYHPAYTYYARDYGIEQIAIEHDGKEPTPKQLAALCDKGNKLNINVIFHQPQYNADKVCSIADEIGAEVVVTDPLAADIFAEIERVTEIICKGDE